MYGRHFTSLEPRRLASFALLSAVALFHSGCAATLVERRVVPENLVASAELDGLAGVRAWGDQPLVTFEQFRKTEGPVLREKYLDRRRKGMPLESHLLALSGGADDGAFGAGLLIGWSEHGDRPEFDLVTGVSAGALIAPFAFLGRDYDKPLSEIFTLYAGDQIYEADVLAGILGGSSLAKSDHLKSLIDKYVDNDMMRRIAEERKRGRLLLVGTTNIDAERPVYWDMGRIASAGSAHALQTLRQVLLASASIPGIFPPVRIAVRAGGKTFEELHVDGGTTREVFFSPADFSFRDLDKALSLKINRRLYVIRNGKINPEWQATEENTFAIGQRSLATVLKNQTLGDLTRMHAKARAEGIDYNLAVIPDDFKTPRPKPFDRGYMTSLFQHGLGLGRAGYAWMKAPPGILAGKAR